MEGSQDEPSDRSRVVSVCSRTSFGIFCGSASVVGISLLVFVITRGRTYDPQSTVTVASNWLSVLSSLAWFVLPVVGIALAIPGLWREPRYRWALPGIVGNACMVAAFPVYLIVATLILGP